MLTTPSAAVQRLLEGVPRSLYLGGTWSQGADARTMPVYDPATGSVLCDVSDASAQDGLDAVETAANAQEHWSASAPRMRGEVLRAAFDAMISRREELALLMTLEMGKPLSQSRAEVAFAAEYFRWFAGEAVRVSGRFGRRPGGEGQMLTTHHPVGPSFLITPWNFPLAMGTRKLGPAIAAGCTVICKPAEQTPLSMLALAQILGDAGLPAGVLSVLPSSRAADLVTPMLADPRLQQLSFTGSTAVGRILHRQAADRTLRVSLELGGNAPFLVLEDADLELAVDCAVIAKWRNMGQTCIAANRFIVAEPVAGAFANALAHKARQMTIGPGVDDHDIGPLINSGAADRMQQLVDQACGAGATPLCGGEASRSDSYYPPTVLTNVPTDARAVTDEIFGPVAPILTCASDDDAVAIANSTHHGLMGYVISKDMGRALRVGQRLQAGVVAINKGHVTDAAAPFGGFKQSGIGREGGTEGINEFLETQYLGFEL